MDHITAKVSCFVRAYHYKNKDTWIFRDETAEKLLGEEEYNAVADGMTEQVFAAYNRATGKTMAAPTGVDYALAVKGSRAREKNNSPTARERAAKKPSLFRKRKGDGSAM